MPGQDAGQLTFFPWVRRGLTSLPQDTLAAGVAGSIFVPVELHVNTIAHRSAGPNLMI